MSYYYPIIGVTQIYRFLTPHIIFSIALVALFYAPTINAEKTCGDIISINPYSGSIEETAIIDCSDPFDRDQNVSEGIEFVIDGVQVSEEDTKVVVPNDYFQTITFKFKYDSGISFWNRIAVYEKQGDDFVEIDITPPSSDGVSQEEGVSLLEDYFAGDPDLPLYREMYLGVDDIDLTTEQENTFYEFINYLSQQEQPQEQAGPQIPLGRYWFVFIEEVVCAVQAPEQKTWLAHVFNKIVPTAHAQSASRCFGSYVPKRFSIELNIVQAEAEPTGASSVLFLPGIMGSRLYEKGQQCGDFGVEQERWFSESDCDQLRLLTRFDGTSLNDIYTKAEDDAVVNKVLLFFNLYRSFIQDMNDLEESDAIADFVPFAYDWRLRLDDLLKTTIDPVSGEVRYVVGTNLEDSHLYQTVEEMVSDSHNDKVTIVAHSNGGLLAKTFLSALQATGDPLADKIDNVILVASPQVGTPDAVTGLLHGNEIGAGFVVSQEVARILLNTAPFGHHLLPNQNYFNGEGVAVRTPVVTFKTGAATDEWRSTFGSEITSTDQLHQFLSKDSGRPVPVVDDLLQPQVVDNFLLNYANVIAAVVENWTPNADTNVYQIAGTGIETTAGLTYFTDTECITGGFLWFECSQYAPKLGYYINHTHDGDGTVVVPSALGMKESDEVERVWLDLASAGRVHNNIMEVPELSTYITDIIQSAEAPALPSNFSSSPIIPEVGKRLSFFLHSPLDMYVESSVGLTSSSTDEIPGVTYRRYGEVQYLSVPADSTDLTLQLRGYENGSFTLVVQEWDGEVLVSTESFEAIPTGAKTIIELPLDSFAQNTSLEIDFDGDGVVDGVVSVQTDRVIPVEGDSVVDPPVPVVSTENISSSQSSATRLGQRSQAIPPAGQVAGVAISTDEQWYYQELLKILEQLAALIDVIEQQYEI
jgi:hypothetical protein